MNKISVCIATYNGERYIEEQLTSILKQIATNDEIVISDDNSQDNTINIINAINDKRIKVYRDKQFHSPIFNMENALKHAKGDIIMLADQDDVWVSNKVKKQVKALKEVDLVFSNAKLVDENLIEIRPKLYNGKKVTGLFLNLFFNKYIGATMAFNRKILERALPFPKSIPMHDQWIGVIGEFYYKTAFLNETLILYRRHGNNASFCGENSKNSFGRKFMFRVNILIALLGRVMKY